MLTVVEQKGAGGTDCGCCNLWGYQCERSVEGGEGKSVTLRNYHIIVPLKVCDCFVYQREGVNEVLLVWLIHNFCSSRCFHLSLGMCVSWTFCLRTEDA